MDKSEAPLIAAVTVVVVTYGDRWRFLVRVLQFLESSGYVDKVVVVDNGAHIAVAPLVNLAGLQKPVVVRSDHNRGSAAGFKLGLETAVTLKAGWIFLLDDDNVPDEGSLERILRRATETAPADLSRCAFVGFRPAQQPDIAAGIEAHRCFPGYSSFCGFHVADVPRKIWRRVHRRDPSQATILPESVLVPYAPYSGLFFHSALLKAIGMPNEDLVLYADDTEFSNRIVKGGGQLRLLTGAKISELEPSWNAKRSSGSSFEAWLKGGSEFRAFYGARNRAYFDYHCHLHSKMIYRTNRLVYLTILRLFALRYRAPDRYALFHRAIKLGEASQLGIAKDYPLP